jgi:hypothetical protein
MTSTHRAQRSCLATAVALLAVVAAAAPLIARPSEEDYASLQKQLDKKIPIQLLDTPFDRAMELLQRESGVTFLVDRLNLGDELKRPVSLQTESMPIGKALDWITIATGADWDVRDGVVFVSTPTEVIRPHVVLHVYDVRALTQSVPNFDNPPNPEIDQSLSNTNSGGSSSSSGVARQTTTLFSAGEGTVSDIAGLDPESMAELVKQSTPEGRWDQVQDVSVTLNNGILMVRHTPQIQKKVADLLEQYQKAYGKMVSIDAYFVQMRSDALEKLLANAGGKLLLDAAHAEAFVNAAKAAGGGGKIVGVARVVCFNAQRVNLSAGNERAFISDVEPIPGAPGMDPTLSTNRNGAFLDIRPTVAFDNSSISLLLRSDLIAGSASTQAAVPYGGGLDEGVTIRSTGSVNGTATPNDADAKKPSPAHIDGGVTLNGRLVQRRPLPLGVAELTLPAQDLVRYRTMARVPDGGAILLSGFSSQFAHVQADGSEMVLVVRARVAE